MAFVMIHASSCVPKMMIVDWMVMPLVAQTNPHNHRRPVNRAMQFPYHHHCHCVASVSTFSAAATLK